MVLPIFILISVLMFIFIVVPPFLISKYSNMKGSASFFRDDDEYKRLKPILTPPNKVFSIVWPILYVLMAVSIMCATLPFLYNLIQNNKVDSNWVSVLFTVIFFCAQLCLNWAWVPLFIQKRYKTTFIFSILMILFIICYMISASSYQNGTNPAPAILISPLLVWLCYATYLNGAILRNKKITQPYKINANNEIKTNETESF